MTINPAARSFVNPRACRRRIALAAACFLALNLGTTVALDIWPVPIRFADAHDVFTRARALPAPPDILFLGSSIFRSLIDLPTIDLALGTEAGRGPITFSAAVAAGDLLTMRWLQRRLQDARVEARHLVVELTPECLTTPTPFLKEDLTRFFTTRDVIAHLPDILRTDGRARLLGARLTPLYFFRLELLRAAGLNLPTLWLPRLAIDSTTSAAPQVAFPDASARPLDAPGHLALVRGSMLGRAWADFTWGTASAAALEEIVDSASRAGATVTLVIPPASSLLRSLETPEAWRQIDAFLVTLTGRGPVSVLNYRTRLDDRFFFDAHHAAPGGAQEFSRLFAQEALGEWRTAARAH